MHLYLYRPDAARWGPWQRETPVRDPALVAGCCEAGTAWMLDSAPEAIRGGGAHLDTTFVKHCGGCLWRSSRGIRRFALGCTRQFLRGVSSAAGLVPSLPVGVARDCLAMTADGGKARASLSRMCARVHYYDRTLLIWIVAHGQTKALRIKKIVL